MLDVFVRIDTSELDQLNELVRASQAAAAREVAQTLIIPAMRNALSFHGLHAPVGQLGTRSGRLLSQLKTKFWKAKDGLVNGAVRIIGDRDHVSRFNELGTKSHGRRPKVEGQTREAARAAAAARGNSALPARKMFETVGTALRAQIESQSVLLFERNMKALGQAGNAAELKAAAERFVGIF